MANSNDDTLSLTLVGWAAMQQRLALVVQNLGNSAAAALRAEAEIEMTEAKKRTPVLTGTLRNSGTVTGPDDDGVVKLSFGGAASDYAIEVHENLEMFHPRGGQAKFLESTVLEAVPYLAQRVAERVQSGAGNNYAPSAADIAATDAAVAGLADEMASAQDIV